MDITTFYNCTAKFVHMNGHWKDYDYHVLRSVDQEYDWDCMLFLSDTIACSSFSCLRVCIATPLGYHVHTYIHVSRINDVGSYTVYDYETTSLHFFISIRAYTV